MSTLRDEITFFLSRQVNDEVTIEAMRPLAGGASMETWSIDATWRGESHALILRRDMAKNMFEGALSRAEEFALLGVANRGGVMAPAPLFLHTESGRPYFLMARLPGVSLGSKVVRDPSLAGARKGLAGQMGAELAKIHRLDPATVPFLKAPAAGHAPSQALTQMAAAAHRLDPSNPVWAFGLRWLETHLPPAVPNLVLHGDFRIGNLLVTPAGLSGVLDWEFAHLGDPAEDLAWPLVRDWRFGKIALHVGGVGTLDDYLQGYLAGGGGSVEPERLRWWEIAGNLRWAILAVSQADRHLSGADPSVELASLGRKSAEMEWEMLRLIEQEVSGAP